MTVNRLAVLVALIAAVPIAFRAGYEFGVGNGHCSPDSYSSSYSASGYTMSYAPSYTDGSDYSTGDYAPKK